MKSPAFWGEAGVQFPGKFDAIQRGYGHKILSERDLIKLCI
jgi:hypothetical protein